MKEGNTMQSIMRYASALCVVYAALIAAPALGMDKTAIQVAAAGSCTSTYNTCVARCRRDVPHDKACPSDHCAPKLTTCRSSGCWQEGQRYGGQLTCNLKRS